MTDGSRWGDLEDRAPDLAAKGRALLERHRFLLAGTIRRDGTPRISPVEAHAVGRHLMLVMLPGTQKARDLARDSRLVLQSPVSDAADPGEELKLPGRVTEVDDDVQREATADAIERSSGWRPAPTWRFFSVVVDRAAHLAWTDDEMHLTRWDPVNGVRGPERRRLDRSAGSYRPHRA